MRKKIKHQNSIFGEKDVAGIYARGSYLARYCYEFFMQMLSSIPARFTSKRICPQRRPSTSISCCCPLIFCGPTHAQHDIKCDPRNRPHRHPFMRYHPNRCVQNIPTEDITGGTQVSCRYYYETTVIKVATTSDGILSVRVMMKGIFLASWPAARCFSADHHLRAAIDGKRKSVPRIKIIRGCRWNERALFIFILCSPWIYLKCYRDAAAGGALWIGKKVPFYSMCYLSYNIWLRDLHDKEKEHIYKHRTTGTYLPLYK